ncbi:MAG TPA: SURF1 family cytochrome oxidase biogenesis protein [Sphingomicrobium sp.]|jgi:cytochrome oxidase assembly protein ShyY1|nr:SURF1 family cytochrome oxidase biogenesis protein [Sphingomicrobium sp.]
MTRRLPLFATAVVALAVAAMIALGVWQLQRAQWKAGLLAKFRHAEQRPPIAWPTVMPDKDALPLFRHATGVCLRPVGKRAVAGENRRGETGYVQIVDCTTGAEGPGMSVEVGWSKNPNAKVNWAGGPVSGIIVPDRRSMIRLVAASAPPGLEPSAPPRVESVSPVTPAGHRMYAFTWFALAATALLIYGLAVRKKFKRETGRP